MNGRKSGFSIGTGSISILTLFVVLCLTTFAALALTGARADKALADNAAQAVRDYYAADLEAETHLADILTAVKGDPQWQEALETQDVYYTVENGALTVAFTQQIDARRTLKVRAALMLDQDGLPGGGWQKQLWQVESEQNQQEQKPNLLH
ncbi:MULTISPECIES: hypothetical protein [unclassified Clostridium]|uniref:hypothetical protein n=1 Tax=unclassified Clostridium TaxID=2614128 RepID=UPI0008210A89|nr:MULTISPECIES: hypothetical protein [unclassified Clostridium]SCI83172.1 Uncharacterised protein [uncultured Clostridium sp.]